MKRNILFSGAIAVVALMMLGNMNVQAQSNFATSSGDWSDPLNWSAGLPVSGQWTAINDGHTIAVDTIANVGLFDVGATGPGNLTVAEGADLKSGPNSVIRVGQANGAVGNVTMTGGNVIAQGGPDWFQGEILIADAGKGTWNITGGTLTAGDEFLIGFIGNADGKLDVGGGTVNSGRDLVVGVLAGTKGLLNVSNGFVNVGQDLVSRSESGPSATIMQSGGTINVTRSVVVGRGGPSTYTQTGGAIVAQHIYLGDYDNSHGTLSVSGGSISLSGNLSVGGALASNAIPYPPGHALNADGTLIITGPDATIDVVGDLLADPNNNPKGQNDSQLVFNATSGGVSTIDVAGVASLNGAMIDFNLLSAFPLGSTFDLITATSISSDYVQEPSDVGSFSLSIVSGGNGQILRATLVPEPTSVAMLVVGVVGFWGSRRTRGC